MLTISFQTVLNMVMGLSPKIVDMIDNGLVITVDNGISACEAALLLKEKKYRFNHH